ncbi:MAG: hypothetical protein HQK79_20160 [Desulfobacterales bacterium]|nr:hypothetical protein [Desulfobacterales bacterium]
MSNNFKDIIFKILSPESFTTVIVLLSILLFLIVYWGVTKKDVFDLIKKGKPEETKPNPALQTTQQISSELPKITLDQDMDRSWKKRLVCDFEQTSLVADSDAFYKNILKIIDEQRTRKESITFNFVPVCAINKKFIAGWEKAVLDIIEKNNIFIQFVFPENPTQLLEDLFNNLNKKVNDSGTSSIVLRKDERKKES